MAANRLPRLRHLRSRAKESIGSIVVGSGAYGSESIQISSFDLQAALALLIERDEILLASFNVAVEKV